MKRSVLVVLTALFIATSVCCLVVLAAVSEAQGDKYHEKWKEYVGKRVNVVFACCGTEACIIIQNAKLKEITDKGVVVVKSGSPYFIAIYMVKRIELAR
jgi:hypothetical protein